MAEKNWVTDAEIRDLLARQDIHQLHLRYAAAVEARDIDAMTELFVPHARYGEYGEGPGALRQMMSASLDSSVFAVILVSGHLIEVDGEDSAHGQVWAQCFAQTHADGFVEQLIKYEDRYQRHSGRWRFLHRRHRLYYGVARPESPLTQQAAEWPRSQIGVGDLPLSDPAFLAWWSSRGNRNKAAQEPPP